MSIFTRVQTKRPKSSVFNLSHEKKLTANMGKLYPVYLEEILPSDKLSVKSEYLIRFHPMLAPIMHRIDAHVHYFYVPNRLVFKDFDKFITGGEDGNDSTPFPQMTINESVKSNFAKGSLADYFGIPPTPSTAIGGSALINALPFRAYQLIFNEYYRDQNLQEKVALTDDSIVSAQELAAITAIQNRCWSKDYFTSALPWAQKGGSVILPSDVEYLPYSKVEKADDTGYGQGTLSSNGGNLTDGSANLSRIENIENLGVTINDLRTASRLQEWLEKNARAGSRLFESLLVHFGVISDDLRLGRPLYLGGGKTPVTISEVLSTFENAETELGKMGGHGIGVGARAQFRHYFKEHGYVIGILSIMPKPSYQQGIHPLWSRKDKFDFAWPEFANLREQPILNKELYKDWASDTDDDKVFGYTPRYSEYKHGWNTVHGDMRESLAFWHAGRIFANRPLLNEEFIKCNTSSIDDRIFPVADAQASDKLYIQLYNSVKAVRPLPYFGTPRL